MNSALMFSKASDEWETPQDLYDEIAAEFQCTLDVAATNENTKCEHFISRERDALTVLWAREEVYGSQRPVCWMNPPYSRCKEFVKKAAVERGRGVTTVALVPSRTDTYWWHAYVWDRFTHQPQHGVEVRFIKGRLKFGNSQNSAPFPSVVIVFRGAA